MEGQSIPQCQLMMEWERKDEVPTRLVYKVVLNGTRPSNDDFLLLVLDPAEGTIIITTHRILPVLLVHTDC